MIVKKVAVLLCKFSDTTNLPAQSKSFYEDLFVNRGQNGQNDYWLSVSFGNVSLDGSQVFDWKTFDITLAKFIELYPARNQKIEAVKRLFNQVNFTKFDTVAVIPNGDVKDAGSSGGVLTNIDVSNNNTFISHELGHSLFHFDHSFDDSDRKNSIYSQPGEYFDTWDIMSAMAVSTFTHPRFADSGPILNAPYSEKAGWLDASRIYITGNLHTKLTKNLRPLNHPELTGFLAIKYKYTDLDDNKQYYYMVEFRVKDGWDAGIPQATVLIHRVKNGISYLIRSNVHNNDHEWLPGQVFRDARNNVKIEILSLDASAKNAVVSIGSLSSAVKIIGNFDGNITDDVLTYFSNDGNWWLATFNNDKIAWSQAGNTAGFGQLDDGRPFWKGNFSNDNTTNILFYYPGDGNWWLGKFINNANQGLNR